MSSPEPTSDPQHLLKAHHVALLSHQDLLVNRHYFKLVTDVAALETQVEALQALLNGTRAQAANAVSAFQALTQGLGMPDISTGMSTSLGDSSSPVPAFSAVLANRALNPSTPNNSVLVVPERMKRSREEYPNVKFWAKDDAMNDPVAHSNPNIRRPILKLVMENADGTLVSDARFAEIQQSVRLACTRFLDLTKSWTKQTTEAQSKYIAYVESLAEELAYCDESGWKSIDMARTYIDGKTRRARESGVVTESRRKRKTADSPSPSDSGKASKSQKMNDDGEILTEGPLDPALAGEQGSLQNSFTANQTADEFDELLREHA